LATHKSAKKRIRQSEKRRQRNQNIRSRTRTIIKKLRHVLASEDTEETKTANFRDAERALRQAASKGVIPKRRASRQIGRLARRLNLSTPS
jgi:small subunit ribosomal protein S20